MVYAPLFGLQPQRSGSSRPCGDLAAALSHGSAGRGGHCFPEALARDYFGALFPLQPLGNRARRARLATLVSGSFRGAPAMTETISEQPGGPERPATGPADPVFEWGPTGSTPSPNRPARVLQSPSPGWLVPLAKAPCPLGCGATAATVLWALAARDGARPRPALRWIQHLVRPPASRPGNWFWLLGCLGGLGPKHCGGTPRCRHIGSLIPLDLGRWTFFARPRRRGLPRNFSASSGPKRSG